MQSPQDYYKLLDTPVWNVLLFFRFASWCKDSAIPSRVGLVSEQLEQGEGGDINFVPAAC